MPGIFLALSKPEFFRIFFLNQKFFQSLSFFFFFSASDLTLGKIQMHHRKGYVLHNFHLPLPSGEKNPGKMTAAFIKKCRFDMRRHECLLRIITRDFSLFYTPNRRSQKKKKHLGERKIFLVHAPICQDRSTKIHIAKIEVCSHFCK